MSAQVAVGGVSPSRVVVIGAVGGAIAGMMMAMIQMIYGLVADGHTLWDAPMAIWAWVGGIDNFGAPGDHIGAIVLGLGGHMANSMMIGAGFALLLSYVFKPRGLMTPVIPGRDLWARDLAGHALRRSTAQCRRGNSVHHGQGVAAGDLVAVARGAGHDCRRLLLPGESGDPAPAASARSLE